ncbi:MAG: cobalamin-dependent protein [Candidatus Omnitrophica bacterium]|nr:cobalamin-dependent protein [Candidatus Omnitrophota bacterium]
MPEKDMKKIRKVLLVVPPVTRPSDFSAKVARVTVFIPLGIAYIAATIENTGRYEVSVLDALIEGDNQTGIPMKNATYFRYGLTDEELAQRIKDFQPDVVGVSCLFSAAQDDMANVCRIAKRINPDIVTIVGGTHIGNMAEEAIGLYPAVDFVIVGEAERTFLDILEVLEGDMGLDELNGVAFRKGEEKRFIPKTQYIQDLDKIDFPAYHFFNLQRYFDRGESHGFYRRTPYMQMITSRGCPCHCTFCALGPHWGARQRKRSAKNILDEMEKLIGKYGIQEFHFEDDNLTADKKRAIELFDGMIERKFNILWHAPSGIAAYTLSPDIIEKMAASGCYSITIAIESGSQRVLTKLMRKPVDLKKIPALVQTIRKHKIDVRAFFMLGFPGETKEDMKITIDYARGLELDWAYFSIFSPLPKTKMYDVCLEKGYIKEGDFDPIRSFHRSIVHTPEFAPEELQQIREEAIVDICFRNNPNLRKYDVDTAIENFSSVVRRYPHFDFANFYLAEAYLRKGDKKKAAIYYQKTIQANPAHREAISRLKTF